ncbi:MAG: lytic transglycosylase domain-containing protein [Rickettsiaceae bacterium]|nr:lytic transglycosylase domain-containing protein [Rickettsiaceae bacterium]
MKKLTKTRVIIKRSRVLLENKVSRKSGTTTVLPAIAGNTNSDNFRGLVLITLPCLLTNILLSSIQQTRFKKIINQGTKVKEIINVTNPSKFKFGIDESHSLSIMPKAVTAKNIRFRKLSLFSRTFIKPIISLAYTLKYKIISLIVSRLGVIRKAIRLLLVNFSFIDCFAGNIDELIDKTESYYAIPSGLLKSIARVESGNKPYALNIAGRPIIVNSKEEAASIVRFYQNAGITNIDLGIAQINLRWHGKHFSSISEMLEPKSNLEYAAKLLNELYRKHGSWCKAVRHYHSANPDYHKKYSRKVLIAWLKGDDVFNNINVK